MSGVPVGRFSSRIFSSLVFDERAQAVAVRGDEDVFALTQFGRDVAVPIGQNAGDGVFQAFTDRYFSRRNFAVATVVCRVVFACFVDGGRRHVEAAAPDVDLVVAVFGGGFGFVQSLQAAIVAFVQAPAFVFGYPQLVAVFEQEM